MTPTIPHYNCTFTHKNMDYQKLWISVKNTEHEELEGKYSLESTDPRKSEIRAHLRP